MLVRHLNCGTMRPPGGRLIDGDPGLLRRARMVCHCLLVETEDGLVLVDTGVGLPATDRPAEWLGKAFLLVVNPVLDRAESAVEQLKALGYRPEDVRHIVPTHLDLDHAGGLADFPEVTVHVYQDELDAMRSPADAGERSRYRSAQFAHGPKFRPYHTSGEPWFGFDAVRPLDGLSEDILIVPLTGHSRGHAGVAVRDGDRWLLHAGDAYFHPGELAPEPHAPAGVALFESLVQQNKHSRLHNQSRLRELAATHGDEVTIFSAHAAADLRQYPAPSHP
ncbi:MBL fold metallo-hydrolase [Pseudonocardia eucalypti]|uniref:MBL fold metallo-hydrolase n=1 Tax=Pseudonocardia eucalypti TaxID=648755 RepID=A0ABP9Q7R5_9PSEU|nr:glyoxylase-like metal-dependent hydrolase (beta-lactamase superfamily II) [Pseudonocardia eucalypti]